MGDRGKDGSRQITSRKSTSTHACGRPLDMHAKTTLSDDFEQGKLGILKKINKVFLTSRHIKIKTSGKISLHRLKLQTLVAKTKENTKTIEKYSILKQLALT